MFVDGGVRPGAIQVVPEAVDVQFFDPERVATNYDLASQISGVTETTTVFLSIFKWEERKAWRVLLKAYFEAFTKSADVALVLLTNAYHAQSESASDFMDVIENFTLEALGKPLSELPRVHVLPPQVPQAELPSLYKAATAFVLPSRGEGWGRPHVEAMAMELPVIATFWSGTTEYMTQENSYPLRIDGLVEVCYRAMIWVGIDVSLGSDWLLCEPLYGISDNGRRIQRPQVGRSVCGPPEGAPRPRKGPPRGAFFASLYEGSCVNLSRY